MDCVLRLQSTLIPHGASVRKKLHCIFRSLQTAYTLSLLKCLESSHSTVSKKSKPSHQTIMFVLRHSVLLLHKDRPNWSWNIHHEASKRTSHELINNWFENSETITDYKKMSIFAKSNSNEDFLNQNEIVFKCKTRRRTVQFLLQTARNMCWST